MSSPKANIKIEIHASSRHDVGIHILLDNLDWCKQVRKYKIQNTSDLYAGTINPNHLEASM